RSSSLWCRRAVVWLPERRCRRHHRQRRRTPSRARRGRPSCVSCTQYRRSAASVEQIRAERPMWKVTMRMLARAEWGATVPTSTKLMVLPARGVHVHHSVSRVTGDPAADMREIEAIGRRRFGRFPYSFCLHPSGVTIEGAGLSVGAHTEGWNSTTFGVCLIGNYENDWPTDAQVQAFGELYRWLVGNGWLVPDAWIEPHRARKATACPGARTMARWSDLI